MLPAANLFGSSGFSMHLLTPEQIPAWTTFSPDEQRLFRRQVESFADVLERTDYEIGWLVQALADIGELDNTLFMYILGDNGSSADGSIRGTISEPFARPSAARSRAGYCAST